MKKQPPAPLQLSALERAIRSVSPAWGASRARKRMQAALSDARTSHAQALAGGYAGASFREAMTYWQPGAGDADSDTVMDLTTLRERSRDLVRNSPVATGALEVDVSHVVGTGLTMQANIDAKLLGMDDEAASEWQSNTERLFAWWAGSEFADAYGVQSFYEQQDLAYRTTRESGDGFVVLASKQRPDWPFRLALQVIEADRASNPDGKLDDDKMVQGIERAADGEVVAVHFADRHPGASHTAKGLTKWSRVAFRGASGRRNVLHLFRKTRPGLTRGVPVLAPVIDTVKQLTRYATAEVDAAVNSAAMAIFTKMDPEAFEDLFDDSARSAIIERAQKWDGTLQSGAAVNLLPGEDVTSPTPGRPNPNFDPFFNAVLQQIGMALDIPHEVLTKRFQSSYSAARAALMAFWRSVSIRRAWLAAKFCQPIYEEWLADAVALGIVEAPGFFADPLVRRAWSGAKWAGDGPGALDPMKEAQAAEKRMQIGLTDLPEEIVAYDGGDWETKHRIQKRVKERRVEDGLEAPAAPAPGTPGMPGGAPAAKPGQPPGAEPPEPEEPEEPAEPEDA